MKEEVEPVNGSHQLSLEKHCELLNDMRRSKGRQPEGKAEEDDGAPGEL